MKSIIIEGIFSDHREAALGKGINNHKKEARKDLPHHCFYYIMNFAGCFEEPVFYDAGWSSW
jgi:hypothetical protein